MARFDLSPRRKEATMATLNKLAFALVLACLVLVAFNRPALADECCCCDGSETATWNEANYIDVGAQFQLGSQLYSLPNQLSSLSVSGLYATGVYGWSTHKGEGVAGVTLKLGFQWADGTTKAGEELDGNTQLVAAPGFMIGQFLGKRFVLSEGLNVPISSAGPGLEFELMGHLLLLGILDIQFGIPLGFYRTGMTLDDKSINTFGMGFLLKAEIELWGDYKIK